MPTAASGLGPHINLKARVKSLKISTGRTNLNKWSRKKQDVRAKCRFSGQMFRFSIAAWYSSPQCGGHISNNHWFCIDAC